MTDIIDLKQLLTPEDSAIPEPAWLKQMPRAAKDTLLLKLIKQVGLLRGMTRQELLLLLYTVQRVVHQAGDYVFRQGDESGESMFVLIFGSVEVIRKTAGTREETVLATLNPGDTFGETALVDNAERSASVRSVEQSIILRISAGKVNHHPEIAAKIYSNIARMLSLRLRESDSALEYLANSY